MAVARINSETSTIKAIQFSPGLTACVDCTLVGSKLDDKC